MFREPEAVESKPTEKKKDPTAPARSSIRRQRSVRYPAHNHPDRRSFHHPRSHRHLRDAMDALRTRERAGVAATRSNSEHAHHLESAANQAHADASRQRRLESGRAILRDALSYEHPHQSRTIPSNDPYTPNTVRPSTPSTSSFRHSPRRSRQRPVVRGISFEQSASQRHVGLPRTTPPAFPSPPYTSGDHSSRSSPDTLQSIPADASLTSRFAPAHVEAHYDPVLGQGRFQHHHSNRDDLATIDSLLDELPPLRRVNRNYISSRSSRVPSTRGIFDGLGDRRRSVSPDSDPWEILLSTMPPDERLPSTAASSFRSNENPLSHEGLSSSAEPVGDGANSYLINCDDTDSEFTEAADDSAVDTLELDEEGNSDEYNHYARDLLGSAQSGGPVQQALSDRWIDRDPVQQRRLDEIRILMTSDGPPSRERL
ncbi:MAG: hypothetical protein Q9182_003739 [Xanthomendoza sp. 2 TL-2023]